MGHALLAEELPHYTYEDYCQWEGRWELIDGIPYAMSPAPSIEHQRIANDIGSFLKNALSNSDCQHCFALQPVDWKIDEQTIVQPDNSIICHEPDHPNYLSRAPELIVEVLSPSTENKDRGIKFRLYEAEGVRYYLLVNPKDRVVKIYELVDGKYIKQGDFVREVFSFDLNGKCQFELDFSKIWK